MTDLLKGADGKFYFEADAGVYEEFVPPVGMRIEETADGPKVLSGDTEVTISDGAEYSRQKKESSSDEYFRTKRQKMKRMEALQRQFELMDLPVDPGIGCNIMYIKDEKFEDLTKLYRKAYADGEHVKCEFQPLITYRHKLDRKVLAAEVGMLGNQIVCLEAGYGGTVINVPDNLERGEK